MITKKFGDKKITVRELNKKDIKNARKFCDYINSLIKEEAKILMNKPATVKEEGEWLKNSLKTIDSKREVMLIAECDNKIVGLTNIIQQRWRQNHTGKFGISIRKEYRGLGLGKYIMAEVIKLAKRRLKPKPKIIRLEVYTNNIPAFSLYKKMGFKKVACLPKQIQYKGGLVGEYVMLLEL